MHMWVIYVGRHLSPRRYKSRLVLGWAYRGLTGGFLVSRISVLLFL